MEKSKKNIFLCVVFVLILVFFIRLILWCRQDAWLTIYYDKYSEGMVSQIFFDVGEGYSEKNSCQNQISDKTEFILPQYLSSVRKIRGDFSDQHGKVYIEKIEIQKNPLNRVTLSAKDILERIDYTINLDYTIEKDCLVIDNTNNDGQIYFTDTLVDEIKTVDGITVLELVLLAISGILEICILLRYGKYIYLFQKGHNFFCKKGMVLLLGILFINILILQMGPTFNIKYCDEKTVGSSSLYWESSVNSGFSEQNSVGSTIKKRNVRLYTPKSIPMTSQYRIDFINDCLSVSIEGIKLYFGFIPLAYVNGEELYRYIVSTFNIKDIRVNDGILYIEPQTSDPIVCFDSDFTLLVNRQVKRARLMFCLILNIWMATIIYFLNKYRKMLHDYIYAFDLEYGDKIIAVLKVMICFGLVVSAGMIIYMAMCSEFNSHPDELVTRKAIDYYLSHWIPPDIRKEAIADTFSAYGHSRLEELNIYYLLAGKLGWIFKTLFHCANYYRVFNICLYFIICFVVLKNIWKQSWLAVCSIATPQLCYIYSYATSDAWDYFCSFLLLYQVVVKDSRLNKALRDNNGEKKYVWLAFFGVLSAFIFMGKSNYYVVLLIAFFIFLFKLMRVEAIEKKRLMKEYIYILLIFVVVFMTRYSFNLYYYGFNQAEISEQVKEMRAEYSYKNSTAIEDKFAGLGLKERGVSLEELFDNYKFGVMSFKSFCGVYGYMEYYSETTYYIVLGIGYTLLILMLIANTLNLNNRIDKIECFAVNSVIVAIFLASMYHSWTGDYQPQGRYLFPMLIGIGYLMAKIENRNLNTLCVTVMAVISMIVPYGFYEYGILKLI